MRFLRLTCSVAGTVLALGGCDDEPVDFDPFPISIDATSGAVFTSASGPDGMIMAVTIDTLSPLTVLDSFTGGDSLPTPRRLSTEVTLYSAGSTVPRVSFRDVEVFDIHPCDNGGPATTCSVGLDSSTADLRGTIGTNLLAKQSVRFDFSTSELRFFPDTAGTDNDRSNLCESIFDKPFAGGGTLIVPDGEIIYAGNRPAIGACLDASDPTGPDGELAERGTDVLLVVSTGIGVSILSQSAYDRYAVEFDKPLSAILPDAILHLPSGPVGGKRGEIGHLTLTGDVGDDSQKRGPCRELFASRALADDLCRLNVIDECPCPDGADFCRAGAALLLKEPITVVVLPDGNDLLQSLRVELRPEFPEVDGVLGASALAPTRIELDYPNLRLMARCMDSDRCEARPQLLRRAELEQVQACVESAFD